MFSCGAQLFCCLTGSRQSHATAQRNPLPAVGEQRGGVRAAVAASRNDDLPAVAVVDRERLAQAFPLHVHRGTERVAFLKVHALSCAAWPSLEVIEAPEAFVAVVRTPLAEPVFGEPGRANVSAYQPVKNDGSRRRAVRKPTSGIEVCTNLRVCRRAERAAGARLVLDTRAEGAFAVRGARRFGSGRKAGQGPRFARPLAVDTHERFQLSLPARSPVPTRLTKMPPTLERFGRSFATRTAPEVVRGDVADRVGLHVEHADVEASDLSAHSSATTNRHQGAVVRDTDTTAEEQVDFAVLADPRTGRGSRGRTDAFPETAG